MSNIVNVTSQSELYEALSNATGGETILLAAGDYGDLALTGKSGFDVTFPSNVTIASANPEDPAVFTGLDLRDAANLTFDGVTFDYIFEAGDALWESPFSILASEDITIRNSTFDGDVASGISGVDDGYGYAAALFTRDSTGITIEQNEIFDFHRGLKFASTDDVVVSSNDIHSIRSDGMNFAEVTNVLIEDNYIHDFKASPDSLDHRDMIQFWTNGTDTASSDIVIRGNHLDIGNGDYTQSIFMRNDLVDRGLAGEEMYYSNITIEENVIVNGHSHGITVGETDGLTIRNNSVLHDDGRDADGTDSMVEVPVIKVAMTSTNVVISHNVTANVIGYSEQSDWVIKNNAFVQDQDASAPGYYADVFLSSSLHTNDGVHNFIAHPDGMLTTLSAGATETRSLTNDIGLSTYFHITTSDENVTVRSFDASFSEFSAEDLPEGTTYLWNFGDGSTANGEQASHAFGVGGNYTVSLTVQLPNGMQETRTLEIEIPDAVLYSYDGGIALGGAGTSLVIDREEVAAILGADEFSIAMTLTADSAASAGELARLHQSFITSVNAEGELYLEAFTEQGERIRLTTDGANLDDKAPHDISITLDDGVLAISVDGNTLASTAMTSPLANSGSHDLVFGNLWGKDNFEGVISTLDITVNESHFSGASTPTDPLEVLTSSEGITASQTVDVAQDTAPDTNLTSDAGTSLTDESTQETHIVVIANAVKIGDTGTKLSIDRERVDSIMGTDSFDISMTLTADSTASSGEVVRLHQSFVTSVNAKGELYLKAFTEDGQRIRLTTDGANLNDKNSHDISITLDDGVLAISVDGNTLASTPMTSPLANTGNHDLVFGISRGKDTFDGIVSSFDITVNESAFSGASTPTDPLEVFGSPTDASSSQNVTETGESSTIDPSHITLTRNLDAFSGWPGNHLNTHEERIDHFESIMLNSVETSFG